MRTIPQSQIAAAIYDGYDNVNFGLVTFLPVDSTCYVSSGIYEIANSQIGFTIFPNPTTGTIQLTFDTKEKKTLQLEIVNMMGEKVYQSKIQNLKSKI